MSKEIILSISFIMAGTSFMIMAIGCIKNKWVVLIGCLMLIASIILFIIGFREVLFV